MSFRKNVQSSDYEGGFDLGTKSVLILRLNQSSPRVVRHVNPPNC